MQQKFPEPVDAKLACRNVQVHRKLPEQYLKPLAEYWPYKRCHDYLPTFKSRSKCESERSLSLRLKSYTKNITILADTLFLSMRLLYIKVTSSSHVTETEFNAEFRLSWTKTYASWKLHSDVEVERLQHNSPNECLSNFLGDFVEQSNWHKLNLWKENKKRYLVENFQKLKIRGSWDQFLDTVVATKSEFQKLHRDSPIWKVGQSGKKLFGEKWPTLQ